MICFNCGYKITTSDINECQLCGMKFPIKCTSCGSPNPVMAKFCFNCGQRVTKTDLVSSIENFDTLEENRKKVAVIFADVSGFTTLSEKMDPEEVREIINECFNYITRSVYELGGTIDKYIGDCVMILFGAKYEHRDDAKRAVVCAMNMIEAIRDFSNERLSSRGLKLELSIGINYGLVVTGSVGNYFDKDYTVIGDVVNTAQRLQAKASEGTILVSESIYLETKNIFKYSKERNILVKNKEKPVKCYSPIDMEVADFSMNMELVDREYELNLLKDMYTESQGKKSITVIGNQGVGKTNLIKRFLSNIPSNSKQIWVECNSIFRNRVYHTISSILFNIMNISFNDSKRVKKNRLMSFLDYILDNYEEEVIIRNEDFLSFLMGLERDNEFQAILNSMNYDDIEIELLKQLTIFFKSLCKNQSIIIIIDDIHQADASSIKILRNLTEVLADEECLFIFTSRYKIEELNLLDKNNVLLLRLDNLNVEGIKKMACSLLECNKLDKMLLEGIIKFTNGNPMYIEGFVKSIMRKEMYFIKDRVAYINESYMGLMPDKIEKLVLMNISELDDNAKKFLQIASIIGKDFNLAWANELFEGSFDEASVLKQLIQLNIIYPKSMHVSSGVLEKIYSFNQDVVREVVYQSILNKNKRYFHKRIGELIESKYYNELENYYEVLCFHFEQAGLSKNAKKYYYKTAMKYKSDFILKSSLVYFEKFLETTDYVKNEDTDARIVNALINIGQIQSVFAENNKALEYLNRALKNAILSDDIYLIKIMISNLYKEKGKYDKALNMLDEIQPKIRQNNNLYGKLLQIKCNILRLTGKSEALDLAKESEEILLRNRDYENLLETMSQAGIIYFINGSIHNALFYLNKAYQYAEKINNLRGMSRISANLGVIYHASGMISKALEYLQKSIDISKKILNIPTYITGSINLGILYMEKGLIDKAEVLFKESLEKSRKLSLAYKECISIINLADLFYERGDYVGSIGLYNKAIEVSKEYNLPVEENVSYLRIAKLNIRNKSYEEVPAILENAYITFKEAGEMSSICDYYRYKSIYELVNNNLEKALEYCSKSVDISIETKNDMKKLKALRLKGNILMNMDKLDDTIKLYSQSINLAEQLESEYEAAKSYFSKYKAFRRLNDREEAMINLNKAKEVISKVDKCKWTSIIEKETLR